MKNTPTPWSYDEDEQEIHAHDFIDSAGDPAHICEMLRTPEKAKANAEFICRAVNTHDELLEAAKKSGQVIEKMKEVFMDKGSGPCKEAIKITNEFLEYLEKAIAKAEGKE